MNIAPGAQVRINVNLRLREQPATTSPTLCTIQAGVLVTALQQATAIFPAPS